MGYTTVDRQLGEKYRYHIGHEDIHSNSGIDNATVDKARDYFTRLFGVRVYNQDDMNRLEAGVSQYMSINNTSDLPVAAVQRAVTLKQNYFPESLWQWNPDDAKQFPYVADIPGILIGQPPLATLASLLPPTVPEAVINSSIQGTIAPIAQTPAAATTVAAAVPASDAVSWLETYWYVPVGVIVLGIIAVVVLHHKKAAS